MVLPFKVTQVGMNKKGKDSKTSYGFSIQIV